MYGLIVENLASFVRIQWGEGKWDMVRKNAGIDVATFSIHHVYPEPLLAKLAKSAFQVLGVDDKNFFEAMGVYFVEYVGQYGYDAMLTVLGRHLRDFLNGLDNLHEYLKFSYTKMRAPVFYCDEETAEGLRLHYRSRRRGFVYYVIGQIKQVARTFYNQEVEIEVLSEKLDGDTMHTMFQLTFDNDAFTEHESLKSMIRKEQQLPIRASIIFELFPFCIVFDQTMMIKFTGHALLTILPDLVGEVMTEAFEITKPHINFTWDLILERRNNIFQLETVAAVNEDEALTGSIENESEDEGGTTLKLRGQMMHMEEWEMIIFLSNPVLPDLNALVDTGLFINDLSLHDCSRDLVLAGSQQSVELKLALDQEQQKSKKLEESMKKLDEVLKKTDELLYQMIPAKVADRIRLGETSVATCETFESVSILFSDVVTFTDICSRITPIQVVGMLNHMYSIFDQLTERNQVYKVETIGDSYMVVSGAPDVVESHAERICDMAMDMVDAMQAIGDPSRDGEPLKIRVGCHSGSVVAGVVGVKMPRYCLFGDAVNTASRMESSSVGGQIQISQFCKDLLPPPYKTEERGTVAVKGKGDMTTYWLQGRDSRVPLSKADSKYLNWHAPDMVAEPQKAKSAAPSLVKQATVVSESGSVGGVVKDNDAASNTKQKLVRQQTILSQNTTSKSTTFNNEPVEISGKAAEAGGNIVKPTPKPAAAAAPPPKPKEAPKPAPIREVPKPVPQAPPPGEPKPEPPAANESKASATPTPAPAEIKRSATPTPAPIDIKRSPTPAPTERKVSAAPTTAAEPKVTVTPAPAEPPKPPPSPKPDVSNTINLPPTEIRRGSTPSVQVQIQDTAGKVTQVDTTPNPVPSNPEPNPNPTPTPAPEPIPVSELAAPPQASVESAENPPNQEESSSLPNEANSNNAKINDARVKFMEGINGIRRSSRDFREKVKEKSLSTVTIEAMTDMGCADFAVKQKEVLSQACVLL